MGLRISSDSFALSPLEPVSRRLLGNSRGLSSGRRIASAADDPAGLAISERLAALAKTAIPGRRNLNDGLSTVRVAEGALVQTSEDLGRMRELAVQAQNGTTSKSDRATIQAEFDQLAAQVTQVVDSTEIEGQSAKDLGVEDLDVSDPSSLEAIDDAIDSVSRTRANLEGDANRIESEMRNLSAVEPGVAEAKSMIADLDFAMEIAKQSRNSIISQMELGIMVQANFMQSAALRLLG